MRTPITIYYDISDQQLKTDSNCSSTTYSYPTVFVENQYLLTAYIYNNCAAYDLSTVSDWKYGIGNISEGALVESNAASINTVGDGSNVAAGVITIRINTNSTELESDIGTSGNKVYYSELVADPDTEYTTVFFCPINVKNTVYRS